MIRASGLEALRLVTALLQRARLADPTGGLWEAADFQWWWRSPRSSDVLEQSFWVDDGGPVAAVMLTDWDRAWGCDPILAPGIDVDVGDEVRAEAIERSRAAVDASGRTVETLVRDDDAATIAALTAAGFEPADGGGNTWMNAGDRPAPKPLPSGFDLIHRTVDLRQPHWISGRSGPDAEQRLRQVSLYEASLDLAIREPGGAIAGYALFWFDPVTRVGLVEPMRIEEPWQRRGLARSLLAAGLDRLAQRGATRLKVGYSTAPARTLYTGAGFGEEVTDTTYELRPRPR